MRRFCNKGTLEISLSSFEDSINSYPTGGHTRRQQKSSTEGLIDIELNIGERTTDSEIAELATFALALLDIIWCIIGHHAGSGTKGLIT